MIKDVCLKAWKHTRWRSKKTVWKTLVNCSIIYGNVSRCNWYLKIRWYWNTLLYKGASVKKWLGGKSRSQQSEVKGSWGFWCRCKSQTGPGRSPKNFQICMGHRTIQSSTLIWNKYSRHASHEIYLWGNWWWILMNIKFVKLPIITWLILTENGIR